MRRTTKRTVPSQNRNARSFRLGLAVAAAGALCTATAPAFADPRGGHVVAGSATIDQLGPNRLDIIQSTNRAIIDWQSFNIGSSQSTGFQQPGAGAVTLNMVAAGDRSVIAGRLTANGSIVLIDPSGITFSKGARVNVNSLIATPTEISKANLMAGRMKFNRPSADPRARVVNRGRITVAEHGFAALVAPGVANSGVIRAKLGRVVLAAAETYTLDFYGDGLMSFDVGRGVTEVPIGADGKPVTSLVSNSGRIEAPGGTVLLSADAVDGIIGNVVTNSGAIDAQTIGGSAGRVTIDAGQGTANLSGTIDVSGREVGEKGGLATVTGRLVKLAHTTRINASGYSGGGTVWIGGGAHGKNPRVHDAARTIVARSSRIDANATGSGAGGRVTVWSNRATYFAGSISARGGRFGGDGGWIETSGKIGLEVSPVAQIAAGAPDGKIGHWLLDPGNLTVTNCDDRCNFTSHSIKHGIKIEPPGNNGTVPATLVDNILNRGTDVILTTIGAPGTQNGNITIAADGAISWKTAASLTLDAAGNIVIRAPITGPNSSFVRLEAPGGAISESAAGKITARNLEVTSLGDVSLGSANAVASLAGSVSGAGEAFLFRNAGRNLTIGGFLPVIGASGLTTNGGNVLLETTAAGNLRLAARVDAGAGAVGLSSAGTLLQDPGPIIASSLAIIAADRVSLGAFGGPADPNRVGTLAAEVLNPGQSFVFSNDGLNLTIGTVDVAADFGRAFLNPVTGKPMIAVLSGVTTNNANIGLRVLGSGDLILAANVDAGSAGVGLESAGAISQTAGAVTAGTFEVLSVGSASLPDANNVAVLAAELTGNGSSFLFHDDSRNLTIGTAPALLESGAGTPPRGRMLSVGSLSGVTTAGGNVDIATTTSGDLTLARNINANGGSVALVAAGNAVEGGGTVTASNLIVDAAGNVFFGITETVGTVVLGAANDVGTLSGSAGGIFGFLNGPALTIGAVPATLDVAGQSGIAASAAATGDALIETRDPGQPLTLAANITAGGRVLVDTAGGFAQLGAVSVTTPVLAVDTTGDGIARLVAAVPSPSVDAVAIGALPPAATSNAMQFADLVAPNSVVLLAAGGGAVGGTMTVGELGLSGTGGSADLSGAIAGVAGPTAALLGLRNPGLEAAYLFNDCIIAAAFCVSQPPGGGLVVPQQTPDALTALIPLPVLTETVNFITPETVQGKQPANPDEPVINIFDEERLCAQTANPSLPSKERCPERRQR
jgi:filamentous hemagglutinin family protein